MADSIYTFDPTAASNTALDSIAYGPNQLYHSNIDNLFRAFAAKLAQHVDDLGGVNTVGGTADAITVTIASGITAYATGQLFWFKNTPGPNTTAATMNVNSIGAKEIRLQGDTALSGGEMLDNGYYGLLYDAAYDGGDGGWVLLNPEISTEITFATVPQVLAASSTTLSINPAGLASLIQNINGNAFNIADLQGVRLNMAGGIADAYDSETDVDTATSSNESYDGAADLYSPSVTGGGAISGATGTNIGDLTENGGLAAAFDGTTNQAGAASAVKSSTGNGYVGKTYAGGKRIASAVIYGSNNNGYASAANPSITITLRGKNGTAPASPASDGTSLGSVTFTDTANESANPRTITSNDLTTLWDHVWVYVLAASGTPTMNVAEVTFTEQGVTDNMTLVSNAFTATAVPTVARVAVFIDPQESITINTDFTTEVSRDGGTTWTAVTLALVSNPVGTVEQYEGTVSVAAQPSGSSMKYRHKTLNNKDIDVTGTVFQWG